MTPSAITKLDHQLKNQPTEVRFCTRCVVSNQRPRIVFDEEGVCSACRFREYEQTRIGWDAREKELEALLEKHRTPYRDWNVVVPVSGGKDSGYVAHTLREMGMKPLCVCWSPFRRTEIGQQNFDALKDAGFMVLEGHPNGKIHRALSRLSFEELGDAWTPFALGQMSFAFHVAEKFGIALVFFGENGEALYAGEKKVRDLPGMPAALWGEQYWKGWDFRNLMAYGMSNAPYMEAAFTKAEVASAIPWYEPPRAFLAKNIEMHWMSYYRYWDPMENFMTASQHTGFRPNSERSEGTYTKYASLDDRMDGFHFYMGFIKFGIGRATSDAAHEVRDGQITREEAVALVHRYDGEFPGRYFQEFLEYLGITEDHFWAVVDAWRPEHLWGWDGVNWGLKHQVR